MANGDKIMRTEINQNINIPKRQLDVLGPKMIFQSTSRKIYLWEKDIALSPGVRDSFVAIVHRKTVRTIDTR